VPTDAPYQYTAGPEGVEVLEIRRDKEFWDMNIREDPEHYGEKARAAVEANRELWGASSSADLCDRDLAKRALRCIEASV
jgi:hypothetical protein